MSKNSPQKITKVAKVGARFSFLNFVTLVSFCLISSLSAQTSVTVDANGNVVNGKPTNFRTNGHKLMVDGVEVTGGGGGGGGSGLTGGTTGHVITASGTTTIQDSGVALTDVARKSLSLSQFTSINLSQITTRLFSDLQSIPTTISGYGITDAQPLDSDLTAIAALSTTSFGRGFLSLADAAAGRTYLSLGTLATQNGTFSGTSSGTNTGDQTITLTGPVTGSGTGSFATTIADPELAALAGLTSAADKFPYFTGSGTAALADLNSAMRTFLTTSSSANFAGVVSDEVGYSTGAKLVFNQGPTIYDDVATPKKTLDFNARVAFGPSGDPAFRWDAITSGGNTGTNKGLFYIPGPTGTSAGIAFDPDGEGMEIFDEAGARVFNAYNDTGAISIGMGNSVPINTSINFGTYAGYHGSGEDFWQGSILIDLLFASQTWHLPNASGNFALTTNTNGVVDATHGGTGLTSLGTGVGTALGINVGSTGAFVTNNAANTFAADQTISSASLILSGNQSAAAWTTSGIRIKGISGTLTDTSSSGTVAAAYTNKLGGNTIAASSATTFTDYISSYFSEPVAGTNVTLASKWGLGADSLYIGTSNPFKVSNSGVVSGGSGWATSGANTNITSLSSSFPLTTPKVTTSILDTNGNLWLGQTATTSAIFGLDLTNAASGGTVIARSTTPTQAAAGIAGTQLRVGGSDATAGSSTAGAVAGGSVNVIAGDAKRLTSGNAVGGDVTLTAGRSIGTGNEGNVFFNTAGAIRGGVGYDGHSYITSGRRFYLGGDPTQSNRGGYFYNSTNGTMFGTNGTTDAWSLTSSGHFQPQTDVTYDEGDSTHRVRIGYFGNGTTGGLIIGGGTQLKKVLSATATLDFGSTAAGASSDLTITVTGAALGDVVSIGVPDGSTVANSSYSAWVSATDTVKVRFVDNALVGTADPASGTFRAQVNQF